MLEVFGPVWSQSFSSFLDQRIKIKDEGLTNYDGSGFLPAGFVCYFFFCFFFNCFHSASRSAMMRSCPRSDGR